MFISYPEVNNFGLEFVSSGSEYPYAPYIGFPSYAHPIILETADPSSLNDSFNLLKYPITEYFSLFSVSIKNSFPNLILLLTVKDLILVSKNALDPEGFTLIEVDELEYPIPVFTTLTSVIFPFTIIGLNSAPDPDPVESTTTKSGSE